MMNARTFSALQRSGPSLGVQLRSATMPRSRPSTTLARAFDLSSVPQEAVYAGGAAIGRSDIARSGQHTAASQCATNTTPMRLFDASHTLCRHEPALHGPHPRLRPHPRCVQLPFWAWEAGQRPSKLGARARAPLQLPQPQWRSRRHCPGRTQSSCWGPPAGSAGGLSKR